MHLKTTIFLVPALMAANVAAAQNVNEGGRRFSTELTGEAEVNASGAANQGDLDGTGSASITVNPGQKRVCYDVDVAGIATPMRGHIHRGVAGTNGAIVVTFFESGAVDLNDCVDTDRALAVEIIQHPERFYVNIHNSEFPAGALRGQLSK